MTERVLDPRGAAFFPDSGVLAIADLHLGYEAAHRARGVPMPAHELATLRPILAGLVDDHRPDVVVVCGDVKHAFGRALADERASVRAAWKLLADRVARVVLVEGNHDKALSDDVPDAEVAPSVRIGRRVFAHGHLAATGRTAGDDLVLGHEHPVVDLRDASGVAVRARAFLEKRTPRGNLLVLPALSPWAAGYDTLKETAFLGPALARHDRAGFRAHAIAGDAVLDFGEIARLRAIMR